MTYEGTNFETRAAAIRDAKANGWITNQIDLDEYAPRNWGWCARTEFLPVAEPVPEPEPMAEPATVAEQPAEPELVVHFTFSDRVEIGTFPLDGAEGRAKSIANANAKAVVGFIPGTEDELFRVEPDASAEPAKPEPTPESEPAKPEPAPARYTVSLSMASAPDGAAIVRLATLATELGFAIDFMGMGKPRTVGMGGSGGGNGGGNKRPDTLNERETNVANGFATERGLTRAEVHEIMGWRTKHGNAPLYRIAEILGRKIEYVQLVGEPQRYRWADWSKPTVNLTEAAD